MLHSRLADAMVRGHYQGGALRRQAGDQESMPERPTPAPDFEIYNVHPVPQADIQPIVTITKRGHFLLNPQAFEALSYAQKVELLFDRTTRVIGLRSVPTTTPHALWVVPRRSERPHDEGPPQTYIIHAEGFVAEHNINHEKKRRYTTGKVADILTIRLHEESDGS